MLWVFRCLAFQSSITLISNCHLPSAKLSIIGSFFQSSITLISNCHLNSLNGTFVDGVIFNPQLP